MNIWATETGKDPGFELTEFEHGWFVGWPHHEIMLGQGPLVIEKAAGDIVSWGSAHIVKFGMDAWRTNYDEVSQTGCVEARGPGRATS